MTGRIMTSTNVDEIAKMWMSSSSESTSSDQGVDVGEYNEEEGEEETEDAPDGEDYVDVAGEDHEEFEDDDEESGEDEDEAADEMPDAPEDDFLLYNGDAD